MLLPHLPFLHFHREEPSLGMVVTPVSRLRMIICVCALGPVEGTVWWKFSGRLDPGSGTPEDSLGVLGKSMNLLASVSPSPTMGKMMISYQGCYKNEISSMSSC